ADIVRTRPDVVFLDIQMPDLDGFEVIERTPPEVLPVIVFVTAYDQYALEAFRVHALDYLLKPFDDGRFAETLQACRERLREGLRAQSGSEAVYRLSGTAHPGMSMPTSGGRNPDARPDRLVIKARGRVFFLRATTIEWVEADGDYARLHCGRHSYLLRRTMTEMAARLCPPAFARISRSAIVNLDQIRDLVPVARGDYLVRLVTGAEVKLTRTYRAQLETLLGDRL
ncbi:MAG: LytTR family DNA-binding domain-containing protein, partial [Candidatus Eisenbacteria bacterium]